MQELIILGLFVLAIYYLYRRLVKKRNCQCSSEGCANRTACSPPDQTPPGDKGPS